MQELQSNKSSTAIPGSNGTGSGNAEKDAESGKPMSVIGADIVITGDIEASVDLHIEGQVTGDVRCATLILGENSTVNGRIQAERVRVGGRVDGAVETRDLAIEAGARVTGDLVYERLRVASGGVIEGTMKRVAADDGANLKLVQAKTESTLSDAMTFDDADIGRHGVKR